MGKTGFGVQNKKKGSGVRIQEIGNKDGYI